MLSTQNDYSRKKMQFLKSNFLFQFIKFHENKKKLTCELEFFLQIVQLFSFTTRIQKKLTGELFSETENF